MPNRKSHAKRITVDLDSQTLKAYEGGIVRSAHVTSRRLFERASRILCLALPLSTLTSLQACSRPKPLPIGEFTSIAPDIVLTFEYETPEFRVSAHRFSERDNFRVVVETRRGAAFRQCMADAGFHRQLKSFESLKIRRQLAETEVTALERRRSYQRLSYASAPPLEAYEEVLSPLPSGFLSVESEGFAYELNLSTAEVERLGQSCSSPGAPR